MADFDVTITLSGVIGSRTVNITHTYTVEDVADVAQVDLDLRSGVGNPDLFTGPNAGSSGVGYNNYEAPKVAVFQASGGIAFLDVKNDTNGVTLEDQVLVGNCPMVIHHGENFGGNFNTGTAASYEDPDEDAQLFSPISYASAQLQAFALFKTIS